MDSSSLSSRCCAGSRAPSNTSRLVAAFFDPRSVQPPEALGIAQEPRHQKVEQRPQFTQVVFQWCPGQAQAMVGLELLHYLCGLRLGVLDLLRLVENDEVKLMCKQCFPVAGEQRICG